MSFVDLLRHNWQHHDSEVRVAAVKTLDDMALLTKIAQHDVSYKVRNEATSRITDESLLEQIVLHNNFLKTALTTLKKITHDETLFLITINANKLEIRNAAIELIKNERFLLEVLKSCTCLSTCIAATKRITDASLLEEIHIQNKHNPQILLAINDRIKHLRQSSLKKTPII